MRPTRVLAAGAIALLATTGCGGEDEFEGSPDPATERTDRPADPPPGFRVFVNRRAGFSLSVPRDWAARTRRSATLLRSRDRLLAVTVAADRSSAGRKTRPRGYAMKTFRALPGFRRLRPLTAEEVRRSPYASWRVDGAGTLSRRRQRQRITVAAFRRPARVTFTVVAFAAEVGGAGMHRGALAAVLASLRGRRPGL